MPYPCCATVRCEAILSNRRISLEGNGDARGLREVEPSRAATSQPLSPAMSYTVPSNADRWKAMMSRTEICRSGLNEKG